MITRSSVVVLAVILLAGMAYAPYTITVPNVTVDADMDGTAAGVSGGNTPAAGGEADEAANAQVTTTGVAGVPTSTATITAGENVVATGPSGVMVKSGDSMVNTQGNKVLIKTPESTVMVNGNKVSVQNILAATEISADQAEALETIKVSPGRIQVGEATVQNAQKTIMVKAGGADVEITAGPSSVVIKDGMLSVSTPGVSIENGVIKVGDIEVKAPTEVIDDALEADVKEATLETEAGKPVYKVHAEPKQKLFWLFPVTVDTDVTIDAQNGTTIKVKTPWWDFLAA